MDPLAPTPPSAPGSLRSLTRRLTLGGAAGVGWPRHELALGAAFLLAAALTGLLTSGYLLQLATDIFTFMAMAYGWNLISGMTGYVSFGQIAFYGLGGYGTALLILHAHLPWYVAALAAGAVAALIALVLGGVMLRLRGIFFALGMFGLVQILSILFSQWSFAGGGQGLILPGQLTARAVYAETVAVAILAFLLNLYYSRSALGLKAMAIRDDEEAAAAMGVHTTRVKIVTFVLSAIPPAVVAGLVAWNRSYLDPPSMFDPSVDFQAILFSLLGGMGTLWGPALGTVILELVGEQIWAQFPEFQLGLFGLLVVLIVVFFPGGIVSVLRRAGWLRRPVIMAPSTLPEGSPPAPTEEVGRDGPVLEVRGLSVRFGGVTALRDLDLEVRRGETISIIGANGAGKTTLFNAITGFVRPTQGEVRFRGRPIKGWSPTRLARAGIGRTFQIPRPMESMTVWENVLLAALNGRRRHAAVDQAAWVIRALGMEAIWLEPVVNLPPGHRRQVELARALALQPDVILLDEVMAGMNREEQERIRDAIRKLHEYGVSAVAGVEHVVAAIADLCDRIVVLDFGQKIAEGEPQRVLKDPAVIGAYLGEVQE
ncbi:MAG TPA: branched-chain amino acid ABC transporter ATP-binding protein/permease [Candidatus Dormibacteraeota bacterium]|nr:branched-chain amino acid ABC transporter ATP-binding protein/permease [Candidatus Dormibacteraeota bacterium]